MKKICILTATRAEYGLLKPIIKKLIDLKKYDVRIVATGMHMSPEFGLTYKEIENDGFIIDEKIEILLSSDTPSSISKSMGIAMISFSDYFKNLRPDLIILLGDRYETLSVGLCAMNERIPIAHLYGGETTEGAIDEVIRHALTKLSYLHFTSTEEYRKRIIQMGEAPQRVFYVGATGVENALNETLLTREELSNELDFDLSGDYAVVTCHPVTLEKSSSDAQINSLLSALSKFKNLNFILTKANADAEGRIINKKLEEFEKENKNSKLFSSLGMKKYLSALKYSKMVIGNSSSGIIEAPSFGIPTVNIGDRQKGRARSASVIDSDISSESIKKAIEIALTSNFNNIKNPYEKQNTSENIAQKISFFMENENFNLKKSFYDL